MQGYNRRKTN